MATQFHRSAVEYAKACARLKEMGKSQREVRLQVNELQDQILAYMQEEGIDELKFDDGSQLVRKSVRKTESLKKEHISGVLKELNPSADIERSIATMYEQRATDICDKLELVPPRATQS